MQSLTLGNLIGNFLWQGSLNQLWGMINVLQIVVHVQLVNFRSPTNVLYFNQVIMDIAYFEILPDEGLNLFYFWKLIDGSYMKIEEEEENAG